MDASSLLHSVFYVALLPTALLNFSPLFTRRFGRRHRLCGLVHLTLLLFGAAGTAAAAWPRWLPPPALFDLLLGLSGTAATATAALDFAHHKKARNEASGTLDEAATVTYSEMVEHTFYQLLNLAQIGFLHEVGRQPNLAARAAMCAALSGVWLARPLFPVNPFSKNWAATSQRRDLVVFLYRAKKYQYILWKHCLLHGLNITVAIRGTAIAEDPHFRAYWMLINSAYVMEFFLQTLVKKGYMRQGQMLALNQLLMLASTLAAVRVLQRHVDPWVAAGSLALNLANRGHEVPNSLAVLVGGLLAQGRIA